MEIDNIPHGFYFSGMPSSLWCLWVVGRTNFSLSPAVNLQSEFLAKLKTKSVLLLLPQLLHIHLSNLYLLLRMSLEMERQAPENPRTTFIQLVVEPK
jgi:hypothetical protein